MSHEREPSPSLPQHGLEEHFDADAGLLTLSGPLVALMRGLDRTFRSWATRVEAVEHAFPPLMTVAALDRCEYFSSFPHLTTLATEIRSSQAGIERFLEATEGQPRTQIAEEYLTPARFVFPSAACYAVYHHLQGSRLETERYVTLASPCFRHESVYLAGQRQWVFNMREIVCIGAEDAVQAFLESYGELITGVLEEAGLTFERAQATDPFFDKRSPRRMIQRLEPLKQEFLYRGSLAIASLNFHRTFFGERFDIRHASGDPVCTGCVAFGLERWLYACTREFGPNWDDWPTVLKAR